jgi:hypothetical protein
VLVAWDPTAPGGYHTAFHTLQWALPAAIVVAIARARHVRWSDLRAPEAAPLWFLAIFAAGCLLSIHLVHKQFAGSWYFARRQGLMALPAFLLPLGWLLRRPERVAKGAGVLILATTVGAGAQDLWSQATAKAGELREADRYHELVQWLEDRGPVVVAMDAFLVQRIGYRTEEVGYHWVAGRTSYEDLRTMTDVLGARYVVLRPPARTGFDVLAIDGCRMERDFRQLPDEPSGELVFERIEPGPCCRPWREPVWDGDPRVSDPGDCLSDAFLARVNREHKDDAEPDEAP